jgi:hypothetical protein
MRRLQVPVMILFAILGVLFLSWDVHYKLNQLEPPPAPATACFGDELPGESCPPAHFPEEASWDQENLKRFDRGCPHAVYDAPGGNLRQCSP